MYNFTFNKHAESFLQVLAFAALPSGIQTLLAHPFSLNSKILNAKP